jgi:ABC-type cobalamin/Fe3+-siderophores transport system ATPase subunit
LGSGHGPAYFGGIKRMTERLIVKNFLCLKDIDIEVRDFLILVGPQAAGKSLCAKLLYFFRTIYVETAIHYATRALDESFDIVSILSGKFESFFPKEYWIKQGFSIEYQCDQETICKIKKEKNQEIILYVAQRFYMLSSEATETFQNIIKSSDNPEKDKEIFKILSEKHNNIFLIRNIFIPAGRSFFSLLQKNIFRFLQTNNNIDPFLMEFGILYEDIKQIERDIPAEAQALIHSILKGEYLYGENRMLTGGKKVTLELLSSGQQEALPLIIIFAYIISVRRHAGKFTNIYVEEPEAHLFPDAQEEISRLISFLQHNAGKEITFAITTHSPYILAAFNNLIKAGNIVQQNPALKDAVCEIIPESMHINVERFSAYALKDGTAENIIDSETSLINAAAIDGVSESIMETFNALLDIEFEGGGDGENV